MSRIGELLHKHGIITRQQLEEALEKQKKEKKRLGEILIDLGYLSSKELLWMLSEQADIPFVEIEPEMLDNYLIGKFPQRVLCEHSIVPLYETEDKIYVTLGDPTNSDAIACVKNYTTKEVVVSGAEPEKIKELLDRLFAAQQVEGIEVNRKGRNIIRIIDNNAKIEFIDTSGKVKMHKSAVEIVISIREIEGEKQHDRHQ